tara:strand:- start:36 stop:635 length:600 start_codon:yes stop_codon:yes gene_type:complete
MIQKVKIQSIKANNENPRTIKESKFEDLKKSLIDFPEMLQLRPIIVDKNNIILGGNMRYKACQEIGLKEVYIIKANDLTEKQKKKFVIKDNIAFGQWDWDVLANTWERQDLNEWGLNIYDFNNNFVEEVNKSDENSEWVGLPEFEASDKQLKLVVSFDNEKDREEFIEKKQLKISSRNKLTWSTHYPFIERQSIKEKYE